MPSAHVAHAVPTETRGDGEKGHDPVAGAKGGHRGAGLCHRAGALDPENVWHVEVEVARDAIADVEVEMIEAHRFQVDEDVLGADPRRLDVFIDKFFGPAVAVDDDCLHTRALRLTLAGRLAPGYSASATLSLWSASGGPLSSTVLPSGSVR